MLTKLYYFVHRLTSRQDEKNQPSGGYWQNKVRQEALGLCLHASGRLLEVGCGEGLFLAQLNKLNPKLKLWGIDRDALMLEKAKNLFLERGVYNVDLSLQDACNISLEEGGFDIVACLNVVYNLPSLDKFREALIQMKRVCKPQGKIIFEFRNSLNLALLLRLRLARYYDRTISGKNLHTFYLRDIKKALDELGLKIADTRAIGGPLKRFAPIIIIEARKSC